jgi:hypothetical protein
MDDHSRHAHLLWPVRTVVARRGINPSRWRNVAQGSLSSLAALPPHRAFDGAASRYLYPVICPQFSTARPACSQKPYSARGQASVAPTFRSAFFAGIRPADLKVSATAARQEPAPLEEPQGRTAGPALQAGCIIRVGLAPSEGQSNRWQSRPYRYFPSAEGARALINGRDPLRDVGQLTQEGLEVEVRDTPHPATNIPTDHVNVEQRVYRRQVGGALHFPRGYGRLLPNGENSLEIPLSPFSQAPFAAPRVKRKREPADKAFRVVAPARDALREGRSRLRF